MKKKCCRCLQIKPLDKFGKNKLKKDGLCHYCRECGRKYEKQQNIIHPEARKEKYNRRREYHAEKRKEYRQTHKEESKAHGAINELVRVGKLPKASSLLCINCKKKQARIYHHHKGYSGNNKLKVIPVCASCHKLIHAKTSDIQDERSSP